MITNDEIAKLAREYAEEYTRKQYPNAPSHIRERIIEGRLEHMEDFIPWLLCTHCIVSKEKVNEEYETSKHYFEATDSSNPTQKQYFYGRMTVFESLFDAETFKNSEA